MGNNLSNIVSMDGAALLKRVSKIVLLCMRAYLYTSQVRCVLGQ